MFAGVLRFRGTPFFYGTHWFPWKSQEASMLLRDYDRIACAKKLLALHPDPIPRYIIYRDLLGYDSEHPD